VASRSLFIDEFGFPKDVQMLRHGRTRNRRKAFAEFTRRELIAAVWVFQYRPARRIGECTEDSIEIGHGSVCGTIHRSPNP